MSSRLSVGDTHTSRAMLVASAMAAVALALPPQAHAQTVYTWAGGTSGTFSDTAEWSNAAAPPVNSGLNTLSFLSTTTGGTGATPAFTNNLSSGTFGLITFGTAWGTTNATISGSAFTLLGISGTGIDTGTTALGARTISSTITIGNSQTWRHASASNALTVGSMNLGSGTLTLTGVATNSLFDLGGTSFTASSGARLVAGNSALVNLGSNLLTSIASSGVQLSMNAGSTGGWFRAGQSGTYSGPLAVSGGNVGADNTFSLTTFSAASFLLSGTITGANSSAYFAPQAEALFSTLNITGAITGTFNTLRLNGWSNGVPTGTIRLANANSFTATTRAMRSGAVILAADDPAAVGQSGALGADAGALQLGSGRVDLNQSATYSVLAEGSRTLNRTITVLASSGTGYTANTSSGPWVRIGQLDSGTSTFGGGITINRSGVMLSSGTSGSGRANFTGAVTGSNGLTVIGNGVVGLASASSSYTGTTTIRSGVLVVGTSAPSAANGALGNDASAIRLGDTTIVSGSSVRAATIMTVNLASFVNNSIPGVTLVNGDLVLVWQQSSPGQNGLYRWNTGNTLTLVESGSGAGVYGTQYLVNSGSFANQRFWINTSNATTTGFVTDDVANPNVSLLVSAPVTVGRAIDVVANSSSGVSAIGGSLTSGTATFSGGITLNRGVTLQAATGGTVLFQTGVWTTNNNLITVGSAGNAGTVRIANAIGGNGGLTVANGLLELAGVHTYSGATAVAAGSLLVNGSLAGLGAVTVDSGATLGGSGSIAGAVTVNGFLSPGTSPGVLSVASLSLGGASTSLFEIDGATRGTLYDGVDISGSLTYGGNLSLNLSQLFADNTTFNLFSGFTSASGNLAGITSVGSAYGGLSFTRTDNLWTSAAAPNGQTLEFNQTTGTLVIVPEPGGLGLTGLGIAVAAWGVRRRK